MRFLALPLTCVYTHLIYMDIWIKINTNKKNTITKRDEDENNNIEYHPSEKIERARPPPVSNYIFIK